jgi:hypothetical protein
MSILLTSTNTENTKHEFPIFGAPLMFELIRSFNRVNGQDSIANQYFDPANPIFVSNMPKATIGYMDNGFTNYKGLVYNKPTSINPNRIAFNRKDTAGMDFANPAFNLKKNNIEDNAKNIEEQFVCSRDAYKIKGAIEDYWNRIQSYDDYVIIEKAKPSLQNMINTDGKYQGYFPAFHIMYAYMIENTKIFQIFQKIISLYLTGEELSIPFNNSEFDTKPWIENSHKLFFSKAETSAWSRSQLIDSFEAQRRNAYYSLFGLDLNHGLGENNTTPFPYVRPKAFNANFIEEFESFLKLCWQMIINYNNTSNINTTDLIALQEQVDSLRKMLLSRRTTEEDLDNYSYLNHSRTEYDAVVMADWFMHAISYNSPIVVEMGAEAVSAAERLNILGRKVGMSPSSKTSSFLELAPLMATLLRIIELDEIDGIYLACIANPTTKEYALINSIIYNYQLSTGRDIKNQVMINNRSVINNRMIAAF